MSAETEPFDVAVLGGGIMGAATALALARGDAARGRPPARVALIERFAPGHDHGSSHGDGRIVRYTYPEAVYVDMARRAFAAWRELEAASGEQLLIQTGSWECGPHGSPRLAEVEDALRAAGLPYSRWSAAESRRHFPHFDLPLGSEALYQPAGAVARADTAVHTLWRLAAAAGVECLKGSRVEDVVLDDDPPILTLEDGRRLRARRVVLCAGGWTSALLAGMGFELPLRVTREVIAYFPAAGRGFGHTADHRVGTMPTVIDYHTDPAFYALPQIDVAGVKVGWHCTGADTDADDLAAGKAPDIAIVRRIQAYVGDRMPYLDLHPLLVKTCLYTNTPDRHFVIDRLPGDPRVTVGAGFSGHGFKFGPVVGELLADLALDREPAVDLELFRIDRFANGNALPIRLSA